MKLSSHLLAVATLALLALTGSPRAAADHDGRGKIVVSCGSARGAPNYCRADLDRLRFLDLQQQSRADCIRGQTFGFDRGGVWVRGGCRAHFWFVPARGEGRYADGRERTLVCASREGRRNWCPLPAGVRVGLRSRRG